MERKERWNEILKVVLCMVAVLLLLVVPAGSAIALCILNQSLYAMIVFAVYVGLIALWVHSKEGRSA